MSRCAPDRNVLSVKTLQPRRHVCGRGPRSIADGLPEMGTATAHVSVALPPGMIGARTWSDPSRRAGPRRRHWPRVGVVGNDLSPGQRAIATTNGELAVAPFAHADRAACRHPTAHGHDLEQPIVIADDPVIRERARLLELKDPIEHESRGPG